ncbi:MULTISPECIES: sensor histidine kinase [Nostocales]|uniref:GAF domain-containing protein n=3 Tax=Nostocales TaxID=1161 RepID=A0A8S9SY89_9CYAN|nr:GAF domain-containing protein [Tolypothrix bouteillei]KAF3884312.1 GAF domain-containing protein [Tolypothrix bouteillei VB521301]
MDSGDKSKSTPRSASSQGHNGRENEFQIQMQFQELQNTVESLQTKLAQYQHSEQQAWQQARVAQARVAELEQINAALHQRNRILEATTRAVNTILTFENFDDAINRALQIIGESLDCDRVCLGEHCHDLSGETLGVIRYFYEWTSPYIFSQIQSNSGAEISYEGIEAEYQLLCQGQAFGGLIDEYCEPFRSKQKALGVKSGYAIPIMIEGKYWGIVGFDDCREAKHRNSAEMAVLKIAADCAGSAIERQRTQQALLQAEQERSQELERHNIELQQTLNRLQTREQLLEATDLDLDRSLGHVLQVTSEHLGSTSAALWLANPDSDTSSLHLVYLNGSIIPATPENTDRLSGQWIQGREDLSRDLNWKRHLHERAPVIYDFDTYPDITPVQRQFIERLGIKTMLGIPLLLGAEIVGSFTVRFSEKREFGAEDLELIQAIAHQATLTIQLMRLADEAKQTALLEERNRMAGEIHDTLAQAFTGISIQVGMAQKLIDSDPTDTRQILERVLTLAQTGLSEARRSIWALHPTANEYADIAHKLPRCIEQLAEGIPIQVEVSVAGTPCLVPAIVGQNLLRITQEAVNNIVQHAQATQLRVKLTYKPTTLVLRIWDNGSGFEPNVENGGFGLISMAQRASRLNGQLIICSYPGQGTEIQVQVPLQ